MRRTGRHRSARLPVAGQAKARVEEMLQQPAFRVLTVDRMNWINPYTGELVPAPFDFREAARAVLLKDRPWEQGLRPMSEQQVHRVRWKYFLHATIRQEVRLRYFHSDGKWLNPFTARWEAGVNRVNGKIGPSTIDEMAMLLAGCEAAERGGGMLSDTVLRDIYQESVRAESEASARLRATTSRSGRSSQRLPVAHNPTGRAVANESEAFGWTDLFGGDSPFDAAPTRKQEAVNEAKDAHQILTESGIDWALHPGYDKGQRGCFVIMQVLPNRSVCLLSGKIENCGNRGIEMVARLRSEFRYICSRVHGFAHLLENLSHFVCSEFGGGCPLSGFIALIDPTDYTMDSLTMGSVPAIALGTDGPASAEFLGGSAPSMGLMHWDEYRKVITPTITQLARSGTVFAMHADGYRVTNPAGMELGRNAVWRFVAQLSNEKPREVLSRVIAMLGNHAQLPTRQTLPHVGLWAMHVRS